MPEARHLLWAAVSGVLLAALAVAFIGCTSSCGARTGALDEGVRSALDAFALATNPAQDFALEWCITSEQAIAAEAQAGELTVSEARAQLEPVRARCDQARTGFAAIRRLHTVAAERVEAGDVVGAEQALAKLREQWAMLRGGSAVVLDGGAR